MEQVHCKELTIYLSKEENSFGKIISGFFQLWQNVLPWACAFLLWIKGIKVLLHFKGSSIETSFITSMQIWGTWNGQDVDAKGTFMPRSPQHILGIISWINS